MAEYTAVEMANLKKLMAKAKMTSVKASTVFALGQKLKVSCKLHPRIREGMTNAEKNDALDAAMQKYVNCLISSV